MLERDRANAKLLVFEQHTGCREHIAKRLATELVAAAELRALYPTV